MASIILSIIITATGIVVSVMIAGAVVLMAITEFLKTLFGSKTSCC